MKYTKSFLTVFVFGVLMLIFAVPAMGAPKMGQYWIAVDQFGQIVPGPMTGGTGYPDTNPDDGVYLGQWYTYPSPDPLGPWYNMWWYDDPYDTCHRKKVGINFWYMSFNPALPGTIEVTINWSLPEWSPNPLKPPLPEDNGEAFLGRFHPSWTIQVNPGPPPQHFFVDIFQLPPQYNPEWISVDVRGTNFWIMGIPQGYYAEMYHDCFQFLPDLQNPVAVIKGDYKTFAGTKYCQKGIVNLDGSDSSDDCGILAYNWQLAARNNPANSKSATGKKPAITGLAKDTYDVTLTVTDTSTKTDTATMVLKSCFISTAIDE